MNVFLNIAIGDLDKYQKDLNSYKEGVEFILKHANWLVPDYKEGTYLNDDKILMLNELIQGMSEYQGKTILFNMPSELPGGKIVFELDKKCPKTSANFYHLCKGDKGLSKASKKPLYYKGSKLFRLVNEFIVQGGDITRGDGSGGDSIYQGKFNDEKSGLKSFNEAGILGMANSGKNTNTSQFFITLPSNNKKWNKLDGKYVQFGKTIEGIEVLQQINQIECNGEHPKVDITITDCGVIE